MSWNFVVVQLALDVVELRGAVDLVVLGVVDRGLLRYHCDSSDVVVVGRAAAERCRGGRAAAWLVT